MKVALCLSGMPRHVTEAWPLIKKNFVDVYNPDIYSAFWVDKVGEDQKQEAVGTYQNIGMGEYKKLVNPVTFSFIDYDESTILTLKQINKTKFQDFGMKDPVSHRGIGAFYLIESANNLKKQGELLRGKYDVVVRSRSDNMFYEPPKLKNLKPNVVYMSICSCSFGINDVLWYSDSETADKFTRPFSFVQGFDFRQLRSEYFPHEVIYKIIAKMQGIEIEFTMDNHCIYKYAIKEGQEDKHIRDGLYLTKNGWVGHPGFRPMMG